MVPVVGFNSARKLGERGQGVPMASESGVVLLEGFMNASLMPLLFRLPTGAAATGVVKAAGGRFVE